MPSAQLYLHRAACLLASLFFCLAAQAQSAPPAWLSARALGSVGNNNSKLATTDAAGNSYLIGQFDNPIIVGGVTLNSLGASDTFLAKYTPAGTLAWVRQIGSTSHENISDVAVDAAGNVYVIGSFTESILLSSTVSLRSSRPALKLFVICYSPQGTPVWAQQSTSVQNNEYTIGSSLQLDGAGNLLVTGRFASSLTIASTTIPAPLHNRVGAVFLARFSAATGQLQSLTRPFYYDPAVPTGITLLPTLAMTLGGTAYLATTFSDDAHFDLPTGDTLLAPRGSNDVLVARLDAQGSVAWVQQFGGPGDDQLSSLAVDAAGNIYVAGSFSNAATFDATQLVSVGATDNFLAKCWPQGVLEWVQASGGTGIDRWGAGGLSIDGAGNPYVAGSFSGTAQFGSVLLTSTAGTTDIIVAAYTPQGQLRWVQQAGGPGYEAAVNLVVDASGEASVFGLFSSSCQFGAQTLSAPAGLLGDVFVARLTRTPLASTSARPRALNLHPNPAHSTVQVPGLAAGNRVQLLDALGRVVRDTWLPATAQVSVQGLPPGLYTLRATDATGQQFASHLAVE